jgi:molybdopterin molybdotransferase
MPEFLELINPKEANSIFLPLIKTLKRREIIPTVNAYGRTLGKSYQASNPLPAFARSTVDGFAVRALDTHGASDSLPAYLKVVGEVPMGSDPGLVIIGGECTIIHTGGMLPEGADGVVMIENTQQTRSEEIEILRAIASHENVVSIGEDVQEGEEILPAFCKIRAAEIGGLMAYGCVSVQVVCQPKVGIISSGDEVIPPDETPVIGQVRDINAYTLGTLVQQTGGLACYYGIVPDTPGALLEKARDALASCDMLVITAGSSASARDLTASVMQELGDPGVLVHGVNVKPGKPTILGICDDKPVIGLPGNPVSALVIASLFVVPAIEILLGRKKKTLIGHLKARLTINIASQAGREDYVPVRLIDTPSGYQAEPIFGKSNLIFTLIRADGLVCVESNQTGLTSGTEVDVVLL